MNKKELVSAVSDVTDYEKAVVEEIVDGTFSVITAGMVDGEDITVYGFGKFSTSVRKARKGRNPATGAAIDIPETTVPKFKPAKALKDIVN